MGRFIVTGLRILPSDDRKNPFGYFFLKNCKKVFDSLHPVKGASCLKGCYSYLFCKRSFVPKRVIYVFVLITNVLR